VASLEHLGRADHVTCLSFFPHARA
jgi:hypothetical protein